MARIPLGTYLQAGDEIMRRSSSTAPATGKISVIRSVFGTPQQNHLNGDPVRIITPKAIEFRRPSIIRASGHTFEYLGFGPGNYSTALPQVQVRTLSEREEFLVQSQERSCGTVVYTGMNNRGDFFIGNKRVSSSTGQERTFDAPIATVTGEDPSRLSVIFDEVIIKERLVVEGGKSNTILTQFDGPVTFNKLVKLNDELTVNGVMKLNNTFEITSTIQSTSKDTGAFVVEGGIGVEKNLNVGGNLATNGTLTVLGNATIGDNSSDSHTFNGTVNFTHLVNLNGGIDVDNIDIGGSDPNLITTDTGALKLSANGTDIVQVNDSLSVSDTLTAGALVVDQTRLDGNVLQTTSGNNPLTLQAHGTGIVSVNDTLQVNGLKFNNVAEIYTSVDTDLSSVSSNNDTLASAKSIKDFVDTSIGNINTTLTVKADGAGTSGLTLGSNPDLKIIGTANEITSVLSTNTITIGLPDDVIIGSDLTVTDNLTVNGNTTLGNASADTITTNARFASDLVPSGDTQDLGTSAQEWRNLFLDGTANIDSLVADTADIDAGTIDGVTIGGASAGTGTFTQVDVDNINLDSNSIITTNTNGSLTLNPNGSGQTIIQSSVDLNGNLDVSGTITTSGTNGQTGINMSGMNIDDCAYLRVDNLTLDGDTLGTVATNGSIKIVPNGTGSVEIGTDADPADLHCKGDVVAFHTSDITLKENITRIPNALDKVASLSGNTYTWIQGHKYEGQDDTGVIAQEVEALGLPGLTTTREDGKKAVRYERLIPVLIEAIKELKAEIDILKK